MRNLKILFINNVDRMLCYPIYKLKRDDSGYYKLERNNIINRNNYSEYRKNSYNEYCYSVTPENSILERIYPDKIIELKMIVDNLYEFENYDYDIDEQKEKKLVKKK